MPVELDLVVHIVSHTQGGQGIAIATLDLISPCPLVDVAMKTQIVCLGIVTFPLTSVNNLNLFA